jgi:hypothetical protein
VLTEPVSMFSESDQPLSTPRTERCPNCSGAGKVSVILAESHVSQCTSWFEMKQFMAVSGNVSNMPLHRNGNGQ